MLYSICLLKELLVLENIKMTYIKFILKQGWKLKKNLIVYSVKP